MDVMGWDEWSELEPGTARVQEEEDTCVWIIFGLNFYYLQFLDIKIRNICYYDSIVKIYCFRFRYVQLKVMFL